MRQTAPYLQKNGGRAPAGGVVAEPAAGLLDLLLDLLDLLGRLAPCLPEPELPAVAGGAAKPSAASWENEAGKCGQDAVLCSVSRQLVQWGADPITSPITSMNVRSTGARSEGEGGHGQMRSCDARDRSLVNSRIAASSPRVTIVSLKNLPSSMFAAREAGKTRDSASRRSNTTDDLSS